MIPVKTQDRKAPQEQCRRSDRSDRSDKSDDGSEQGAAQQNFCRKMRENAGFCEGDGEGADSYVRDR